MLVVEEQQGVAEAVSPLFESLGQEVTLMLNVRIPDLSGHTLWEHLVAEGFHPGPARGIYRTGYRET
ncbi:MAG: hypothetical protein ACE5JN_10315 [Candidatus Methylomirabilia bacterium]